MRGFLEAVGDAECLVEEGTLGRLPAAFVQDPAMTVVCGGLGKVEFGVRTQHLLDSGTWSLVSCLGTAGRLDSKVKIGDVVIGTETVEHDIRKGSRPLIPRFPSNFEVLERLQKATRDMTRTFSVHFGSIASGDEDILDDVRRESVRERTGAIAVAWEGAGAARACRFSKIPFVEIRGIADHADPNGPRDFRVNLSSTMRNVAAIARLL